MAITMNRANKMKSLFSIVSSLIITVISVRRGLEAESAVELLLACVVAFFFGLFSLYLIFEKALNNIDFFKKFNNFLYDNQITTHYIIYIFLLTIMEVFFIAYTPDSSIINYIRLFLIFLFLLGIIVLSIPVVADLFFRGRNRNVHK